MVFKYITFYYYFTKMLLFVSYFYVLVDLFLLIKLNHILHSDNIYLNYIIFKLIMVFDLLFYLIIYLFSLIFYFSSFQLHKENFYLLKKQEHLHLLLHIF